MRRKNGFKLVLFCTGIALSAWGCNNNSMEESADLAAESGKADQANSQGTPCGKSFCEQGYDCIQPSLNSLKKTFVATPPICVKRCTVYVNDFGYNQEHGCTQDENCNARVLKGVKFRKSTYAGIAKQNELNVKKQLKEHIALAPGKNALVG